MATHLAVDGPGYNVTRRELTARIVTMHELFAVR
jgi:hypothetical protein